MGLLAEIEIGEQPCAANRVSVADASKRIRFPLERRVTLDVIRIIAAILLPPLGVFLQVGLRGHFWLNILLTILGYVPGIIHAVWVIAKK